MEVAVGQEAAGEAGRVVGPVFAVLLDPAELLAQLGRPLAGAGEGDLLDDLVLIGQTLGHRDQGALGPGPGQQGQETQQQLPHVVMQCGDNADNSSLLSEQEVNIPIQELSVDGVDGRMLFRLFCLLNDVCL